jgi:class 3 adenylate cyclase/tetratricopeptide (TPR) repeat protein
MFCSACGTKFDIAASTPREIRKTVTVVFCDVTGSTALGERLDPETLRGVMSRYFERMKAVLESHGGTVEKFIGDAVMAVFGVPVLHEDDALRAVRAAHEMRVALGLLNRELAAELSVTLQTRIGVNTGSVVAGHPASGQNLVTGDAVNVAARLEETAAPGEILIGQETFHLTRNAVDVEPLDPLALKGKSEIVDAYRLMAVRPDALGHERRLDSPMVGREEPLRALLDAFEVACSDAVCHMVTVLGSAGIGKSRLVREFVTAVGERATVLTGRCLSYGEGITYWPIAQMAIQATAIPEDDSPDRAREGLRRALTDAVDAEIVTAHLAVLMGLREGPLEAPWAVRRFFETLAMRIPIVAVFDDVQWAERTLLDVIDHVADWSADAPILLVCVARSEFLEAHPGWGRENRNATSVPLEPLSEQESDRLIENLLGHPALTADIRERIRAAAQGIPLFVEEMLSMLLDNGVLVQKGGEWVATVDLSTVQVPPAISALLAARLDRLPSEERAVLEAASIVGEVFERSAVRALVPESMRPDIDRHFGALLRKDVIRPSHSHLGRDLACRFRHILLRNETYEEMPKAERARLHEVFATHLLTAMGGRASELDEFVGYHLERAHGLQRELGLQDERSISLARTASEHLAAAGHRAFQRGDMAGAASLLGRASNLIDADDPERLKMGWELGIALTNIGSLSRAVDVLRETIMRANKRGDEYSAAYAELMLWQDPLLGPDADVRAWLASAERLVAVFERAGDRRGAAYAWGQRAAAMWYRNRFEETAKASQRALEHALAAGDRYLTAGLRTQLLGALVAGPRPLPEAFGFARMALDDAKAEGDPRLQASVQTNLARCLSYIGEHEEARRVCWEAREIFQQLGAVIRYWASAQHTSRIAQLAGDLDGAADDLRESCVQLESFGETNFLSGNAGMLARVELERGDMAAAVNWTELVERIASPDDLDAQWRLETLRGLLAAKRGDPRAENHLRAVISLSGKTDSSMGQALARLDLARYLGPARSEEAVALAREALNLVEAKGATIYETAARSLLIELEGGA